MIRFLLFPLITFVLLSSEAITAQNSYQEITAITANGDSITGLIPYKNKFKTFKRILITDKTTGISKPFYPSDIKSFTIHLEDQTIYFKTFITQADYSYDEYDKLSNSPKISLVKDTVFAQLLLSGSKSLYFYTDDKAFKDHYLIPTSETEGVSLVNKQYYIGTKAIIRYNSEYKNQLMTLLASPAITVEKVNGTPYTKYAIIRILKDYNAQNTQQAAVYEYKEEKAVCHFGIFAGLNLTSLKLKTSSMNMAFHKSFGVNLGLSLNIVFPNTQKKWSLYNALFFSGYNMYADSYYDFYENSNWYKRVSMATIKMSYIKLATAIRYQNQSKLKPFFHLGFVNSYSVSSSASAIYETRFYSSYSNQAFPLFEDLRKYEQSLFTGAGLYFKKIEIELRYERGNGFSTLANANSITNYFYTFLSYSF